MNRIAYACLGLAPLLAVSPSHAVTNDNGDVLITQAAVNAGGITPGDTAGFPVTISLPGTYRLTTNLAVTAAVNGTEVRANDVTIEMGGHTLAGSGIGRNGIASFNRALTVTGGQVRGFTNDGIRSIAQHLKVINMLVTSNGRTGVYADRSGGPASNIAYATVLASTITNNAGRGIECGSDCRVESSQVSSNGSYGIYTEGSGGFAFANTVNNNGQYGIAFGGSGGAGNNMVALNAEGPFAGTVIQMQPNACIPPCPPP